MALKYKLSPSASNRFLHCSASLPFNVDFVGSKITVKGNLLHEVASLKLEMLYKGIDNEEKINTLTNHKNAYKTKECDEVAYYDKYADIDIDKYIQFTNKLVNKYNVPYENILIEERISINIYGVALSGVIDLCLILPNNDIIIVDYKSGRGKVETQDNSQMLIYALGVLQKNVGKLTKDNKIIISICQPIINNITMVEYTLNDVYDWWKTIKPPMEEIIQDKLVYRPRGDVCKYCQHKSICKERIKQGVV